MILYNAIYTNTCIHIVWYGWTVNINFHSQSHSAFFDGTKTVHLHPLISIWLATMIFPYTIFCMVKHSLFFRAHFLSPVNRWTCIEKNFQHFLYRYKIIWPIPIGLFWSYNMSVCVCIIYFMYVCIVYITLHTAHNFSILYKIEDGCIFFRFSLTKQCDNVLMCT